MLSQPRARSIDLDNPFAPLTGLCELVLVRHGEQKLTKGLSVGETVDPPLSELGERQVRAVATRLATARVDAVYSSPLRRALRTGTAIAERHALTPVVRQGLTEYEPWQRFPEDRSPFEVLPHDEIATIFRDHIRTRRYDAFPYAEDADAFRSRVLGEIASIVDSHLGERVVVTCHGGVINAVLADALGSGLDMPVRVHHTSLSVVRGADSRRAVQSINDFSHVLDFQTHVEAMNQ
ncbi:histidine phosphatase family protein [Rhodococcoides kyotonense]|uniref:Probable phosphoglycerate mutase n=1 Tax=Rhodococcoides kyotonense TaxID=398843 RepID=A0A239I1F3_9NOCA|nr:histidine phosphatase family protein [Rhodococcus kyotonensis]SNS87490.1 probable phosphoglycerate mutase [Rhodococcus kyotonensis]